MWFPIRRAWHKFASPRAGATNVSLSSLSTNRTLGVSASCSPLSQSTWERWILDTGVAFPHAESQRNCHLERRKAKQIGRRGLCGQGWFTVSTAPTVSRFHTVWTAIHHVPTGVSRPFCLPSWFSAQESRHPMERMNYVPVTPRLSPKKELAAYYF